MTIPFREAGELDVLALENLVDFLSENVQGGFRK